MKLRRFLPEGVEAVRATLPQIEKTGDLSLASALVTDDNLTEEIAELDDINLDAGKVFPTTFAFCEYFDSIIHDHNPQAYREDVGFWTWLAFVYLPQLIKTKDGNIQMGAMPRLIFEVSSHVNAHRHLLAFPYFLYAAYRTEPELTRAVLLHPINLVSDLVEQIIARQYILQNQAYLQALNKLYLRKDASGLKKGAGGDGPGAIRRFVAMIDQFGMTRDFHSKNDAEQFMALLPQEFNRFKDEQ